MELYPKKVQFQKGFWHRKLNVVSKNSLRGDASVDFKRSWKNGRDGLVISTLTGRGINAISKCILTENKIKTDLK